MLSFSIALHLYVHSVSILEHRSFISCVPAGQGKSFLQFFLYQCKLQCLYSLGLVNPSAHHTQSTNPPCTHPCDTGTSNSK